MRVLILSDIHGNLSALEAVLAQSGAETGGADAVWCLGDLGGYGPDPNECVARMRALPNLTCLMGNHDKASLGGMDIEEFNPEAQHALDWTASRLTAETRDYLRALPERVEHGQYTLVHGSPRRPVWEYIMDRAVACANFAYFTTPFCLVGHTHTPVCYVQRGENCAEIYPKYDTLPLTLGPERLILNPGSVGQPRDRNPDAAYAFLDTEADTWEFCRTTYDIRAVQARMTAARIPERLIKRLAGGW